MRLTPKVSLFFMPYIRGYDNYLRHHRIDLLD